MNSKKLFKHVIFTAVLSLIIYAGLYTLEDTQGVTDAGFGVIEAPFVAIAALIASWLIENIILWWVQNKRKIVNSSLAILAVYLPAIFLFVYSLTTYRNDTQGINLYNNYGVLPSRLSGCEVGYTQKEKRCIPSGTYGDCLGNPNQKVCRDLDIH